MQSLSNERSFPSIYRPENLGHRRRPSIGKSMPVTALLLNFPPKTTKRSYDTLSKDGLSSPELEKPPNLFKLNDVNDDNNNNDSYSQHSSPTSILSSTRSLTSSSISTSSSSSSKEEIFEMDSDENDKNLKLNNNYDILISDLSDNDGNYDMMINKENDEDEKCSLVNNMKENCDRIPTPICTICLQESDDYDNDDQENLQKDKVKNINDNNDCKENNYDIFHKLCKKLCNDNCKKKKIDVKNYKNKENYCEMNKLSNEIETENNSNKVTDNRIKLSSRIDAERRNFLNDMLTKIDSASSSASLSSDVIDENNVNKLSSDLVNDDNKNIMEIVEEDHDESSSNQFSLRDFNEKYAIAEALAKTSMMTSPAVKRRLAARKIEFELDNNKNNNIDNIINGNADVFSLIKSGTHKTGTGNEDFIKSNIDKEYIPPRELLMYLVRMGSFNSAPKINNPDSQDDSFEIPNGLSTRDLLQQCKIMRGENRPKLLSRQFLKPITNYNNSSMISTNDITEGLHVLELNAISKVCNPPLISPKHIRVFQWNMLSQSLGQHNDNFVCCPDEALLWDNRKYLIIEEILRNSPDIICLQEVDHFKFLERVLGTQNYVGIFFPKPDSPCLYIEENNGPDGCAIFYKNEKFNLINYQTRILEVWRVQSNQVAICINLKINDTNKELCICTTHLKARNGALLSKLRNEQGKDLLKFVTNVSENRPLILCGDFNAEPIEPVYSTILNYKDLNLSSAYADIQSEIKKLSNKNDSSIKLDINNCCKNNDVNQHDHIGCNNDINDTKIENNNNNNNNNNNEMKNENFFDNNTLTEAEILANYEPPYTTWKIREEGEVCHTIDYMFYSKNHFKVNNCLMFPNEEEVGKDRTPSLQYPSDHFSLVCDFEIIDKDDKK